MRVLHIIPAAFHYFDETKVVAESWVQELHRLGVDIEVFTLEYGKKTNFNQSPNSRKKISSSSSVKYDFEENITIENGFEQWVSFDLVHLHIPLLGAATEIIDSVKQFPDIPFIVSYHSPIQLINFFSVIIMWYNFIYIKKFLRLAKVITFSTEKFCKKYSKFFASNPRIIEISVNASLQTIAEKLFIVYNNVTKVN